MPKWLPRILLALLALVLFAGALYGAFRIGRFVGADSVTKITYSSDETPRFDRDRIQPTLRDDRTFTMPMLSMDDHFSLMWRFPLARLLLGAIGALVRLTLLVLLIWLVVKFVTRPKQPGAPAVAVPTTPPPPPPTEPIALD